MSHKILVVEDIKEEREMMEDILHTEGYEVKTVKDGQEAIELLQKESDFDLVISDIRMPVMDGITFLREIRQTLKLNIYVIFLTVSAQFDTAIEALRLGSFDYIPKSPNLDYLRMRIKEALKRIDLERENEYLRTIGGKIEKEITLFFADIKGFSTLTDKFRLENRTVEFSVILNECLNAMSEIVYKYDGIVDKYVGDEIIAIFDEFSPHNVLGNHDYRAVTAGLEMQEKIFEILKPVIMPIANTKQILHIGINTGEVISGTFGSKRLKQFTVFGSEVNLAYRLMTLHEEGKIIISKSTYEKVKDDFEIKFLGEEKIKGIKELVSIYEVIGHKRR